MNESDEASAGEWKEKYMALEALLLKFRGQMSVIRDLTTEKVSISAIYTSDARSPIRSLQHLYKISFRLTSC
ncbi:pleckstrin homology domain-containing family H member 2 [Tachysurus ichikawai]